MQIIPPRSDLNSATDPSISPPPSLSIVVPVYNGASTIGILVNALASLPTPEPNGIEMVLVNDASPDHSLAICQTLLKIQQYTNQINRSVA